MKVKAYFNHLGYWQRIKIFMRTKKRRFFLLFMFFVAFNFIGNAVGFFLARLERSGRKQKKNLIFSKNPTLLSYPTAIDTLYEPSKLSTQSFEKLGDAFLRLDRQLKDGMSRLLILTVLKKSGLISNKEEILRFLEDSGLKNREA